MLALVGWPSLLLLVTLCGGHVPSGGGHTCRNHVHDQTDDCPKAGTQTFTGSHTGARFGWGKISVFLNVAVLLHVKSIEVSRGRRGNCGPFFFIPHCFFKAVHVGWSTCPVHDRSFKILCHTLQPVTIICHIHCSSKGAKCVELHKAVCEQWHPYPFLSLNNAHHGQPIVFLKTYRDVYRFVHVQYLLAGNVVKLNVTSCMQQALAAGST